MGSELEGSTSVEAAATEVVASARAEEVRVVDVVSSAEAEDVEGTDDSDLNDVDVG